jgi:uncharacterized protein
MGDRVETSVFGEEWAARLAYSMRLQGKLTVDRRNFSLPFTRELPEPLRIAFASDLHAGPLTDRRLLSAVFAAVAGFAPHVVLLGGDYVSLHHSHIEILAQHLRAARAPVGMFGVFGNHDLWVDDTFIANTLGKAGVRMLVNEPVRLSAPFDEVVVCGLDEPGTGDPQPSRTFHEAHGIRLLLMHSPHGLNLVPADSFHVAFCGHTHGGQIALPGRHPLVLPRGAGPRRYARGGHFKLPNGELLVSNGVGMSDLPIRLFAHSEVHLCTLQA